MSWWCVIWGFLIVMVISSGSILLLIILFILYIFSCFFALLILYFMLLIVFFWHFCYFSLMFLIILIYKFTWCFCFLFCGYWTTNVQIQCIIWLEICLLQKNDKVLILEKHNIAPEKNRFLAKVFELTEPVLF